MIRLRSILLFTSILILATFTTAIAQTDTELQLGLNRDFGYGGFGNDIQGLFTLKVKNPPSNLARVQFFIDNNLMGEDNQAPFSLQFNTDSYPLGEHTFSAIGYTTDGQEIKSNQITSLFVSPAAGGSIILKIVLPIVGVLILAVVISIALPTILNKGKFGSMPPGTARSYGIGGGAICPKCGRPFPLRLWFINLGLNKIDRCPFCGKWSMVRPKSIAELRAAEAAELEKSVADKQIAGESEADKLKKELDDSRYQNL